MVWATMTMELVMKLTGGRMRFGKRQVANIRSAKAFEALALIDCRAVGGMKLLEAVWPARRALTLIWLIRTSELHDSRRGRRVGMMVRHLSICACACNWVLRALVHEQLSSLVMNFLNGGAYTLQCTQ
jgi:hypothetical protein